MKLSEPEALERLTTARVARLATTGDDGQPHLVPVTFAVGGNQGAARDYDATRIYIAIDHKPKSTVNLRRLRNIRENPRVALLADHYDEDWTRLWWVRADGQARVLDASEAGKAGAAGAAGEAGEAELQHPLDVLAAKYEQYRRVRPAGPVIVITAERVTGWSGGG